MSDDPSALAWVVEEIQKSLDQAHKCLRKALKSTANIEFALDDAVDMPSLRASVEQFHKAAGALELAALPEGARVLRASEVLVERWVIKPHLMNDVAVKAVEALSFAVLDFIRRKIAGKAVSPVALFPQYEAVMAHTGTGMPRPADLWQPERPVSLDRPLLASVPVAQAVEANELALGAFESGLLLMMRQGGAVEAQDLSNLMASLSAHAAERAAYREVNTWVLAGAFLQALAQGRLPMGVHAKRMLSAVLSQLRATVKHQGVPSERLAHDLMFFCAQATAPVASQSEAHQPSGGVLEAVRQSLALTGIAPVDLSAPTLGLFDPAWVNQAIKRVSAAKDGWSAVAAGDTLRLNGLTELFLHVCDSLRRLYSNGNALALALTDAAAEAVQSGHAPSPTLAMEVATSLLYVEASLQDEDFSHAQERERLQRLADRIDGVREGHEPEPLDEWIEALYRRVSDRQTMGSVVRELRATLSECEKHIDLFFRDPVQRAVLMDVPSRLQSMKGVFSVLGVPEALHAVAVMCADVDALLQTTDAAAAKAPQERLATNVSALGFLVDFLGVQPFAAKSLFLFHEDTGLLTSRVSKRAAAVADFAAPDASAHLETPPTEGVPPYPALADTVIAELLPDSAQAPVLPSVDAFQLPALVRLSPTVSADPAQDAEMLEVFIEEAIEVLQEARQALGSLPAQPDDVNLLITLRRAFHTLKGSSRMVGLQAYGEGAWACEQLYNSWLAAQSSASADLQAFTHEALAHLATGAQTIAASGATQGWDEHTLIDAANALRLEGRRQAVALTGVNATLDAAGAADPLLLDLIALDLSAPDLEAPTLNTGPVDFDPTGTAPFDVTDLAEFDATGPMAFDAGTGAPSSEMAQDTATISWIALLPEVDAGLESSPDSVLPSLPEVTELLADEAPQVQAPQVVEPEPVKFPVLLEPEPVVAATTSANDEATDEQYKIIGTLRISIALFNIYLNEADEQSRRLCQLLSEWALEYHQPLSDESVALAHSLAGNSAAVGYTELSGLARLLEHALMKAQALGGGNADAAALFMDAAEETRRLLHQFAAGFLKAPLAELVVRLQAFDQQAAQRLDAQHLAEEEANTPTMDVVAESAPVFSLGVPELKPFDALAHVLPNETPRPLSKRVELGDDADMEATDAIDPDLFPIFEEEAQELLPQLNAEVCQWLQHPDQRDGLDACMRTLHTFKGGARLAGAMRLGELAHRMETAVERLAAQAHVTRDEIEPLLARADVLQEMFDALAGQDINALAADALLSTEPTESIPSAADIRAVTQDVAAEILSENLTLPQANDNLPAQQSPDAATPPVVIDWSTVSASGFRPAAAQVTDASAASGFASVRVKPRLLDRLVNQAGEMSISRTRLASQVQQMRGSVGDLTDNMERLREQLREIELQGETQLSTRMEAARTSQQDFDPLEFDRYTRFQELTRMMAESVNDVATVQRGLVRSLESAEDHLVEQSRLTKELQDDLLRTRMVEFDGLSDRLYRVIRQAAKETGKQVRLDIVGGQTEIDRGVLDRMTAAFEHLLRNCVTHGIELPDVRVAQSKPAMGAIIIAVQQDGNEVSLEFRDDGAGLNLPRIHAKAVQAGLLAADAKPTEAELSQLIFTPGFSTADQVTELAGRGIGMDVVRADVATMGGRIETATSKGQGTSFKLMLPLTTAVTKVVMVRCGDLLMSIPTNLVELVRRVPGTEVAQAYRTGLVTYGDEVIPFFWLGALLQHSPRGLSEGRFLPVLMIRSAQQRVALHIDEVFGNQDVVVKNLGPQLSRVPGLAGMTLQASGAIALIYNPVALATVYGVQAQNWSRDASVAGGLATTPAARAEQPRAPLILVVDDSLTVRRVTQRLLTREGYRVTLAKDGMEALEKMTDEVPVVVLSDIEMPRMNGFDLVRNLRANPEWSHLPIVMITSRIAQKHRDYAMELGVNHYLGKPYSEEELLSLVARYATHTEASVTTSVN